MRLTKRLCTDQMGGEIYVPFMRRNVDYIIKDILQSFTCAKFLYAWEYMASYRATSNSLYVSYVK